MEKRARTTYRSDTYFGYTPLHWIANNNIAGVVWALFSTYIYLCCLLGAVSCMILCSSYASTVYIGFCDYGYSGQSGYSDCNLVDGPLSLYNSDLGYNDLQFRHLCSKIATVDTFGGRYIQWSIVCIGFSDHLVVKPSENRLNLAATIGFSDPDACDGAWS